MAEEWPKIRSRQTIPVSPWMHVIAREVEFTAGAKPEIYHAVGQLDYLSIVALTPDGRIPIVRQYRPRPLRRLPGSCRPGWSSRARIRRRPVRASSWRRPATRPAPFIRSARPLGLYGPLQQSHPFVLCRNG